MSDTTPVKLPKLQDIIKHENLDENALTVLVNQEPIKDWIKVHPMIKNYKYLPRERVEYLLIRIYTKWWLEIKDVKLIANSVVTTVRLYVNNPVTGEVDWNDGVGASPIQIKANKGGAIDFSNMQSGAIQMAAPASETYAFKDAAEKFGKLFGKDLNVDPIEYDTLLKKGIDVEDIKELYDLKKDQLPEADQVRIEEIIQHQEVNSYKKIFKQLKTL